MSKIESIFPDINNVEMGDDELKPVGEFLDIDEVELKIELEEVVDTGNRSNLDKDFTFIRTKLIHSIQKGEVILDNILKMAQMMEASSKDYKTASTILQNIFEGSKSLIDLHKQSLSLKKEMAWLPKDDALPEEEKEVPQTMDELLDELDKAETKKESK